MSLIAVFGGTFNPFHIGHYQMLNALNSEEFIDKILVIPDKIPPHKVCDFLASDNDRIEMCRLICDEFNKAELSLIEFERKGKSYTYDTVLALKNIYKKDVFAVVCGGDMIASLDTWHEFDLLKKEVRFIAFNRDNDVNFKNNIIRLENMGADIIVIDNNISSVSSTQLRKEIKKEYLPPKIFEYITEKGVYNGR